MATIEELLKSMLTFPADVKKTSDFVGLENNRATWERIGKGTWADNLNFSSESEKEKFLSEWCENNEYSNI